MIYNNAIKENMGESSYIPENVTLYEKVISFYIIRHEDDGNTQYNYIGVYFKDNSKIIKIILCSLSSSFFAIKW